jgi:hypothetical protein
MILGKGKLKYPEERLVDLSHRKSLINWPGADMSQAIRPKTISGTCRKETEVLGVQFSACGVQSGI